MKHRFWYTWVPLLLLGLSLSGCPESALPFEEITYTAGEGYMVNPREGENYVIEESFILLNKQGIGTIVIFDTTKVCDDGIPTEPLADIYLNQFTVTSTTEYSVLVLDRRNNKTWSADLSQCCLGFLHKSKGVITMYGDPTCRGLQLPPSP